MSQTQQFNSGFAGGKPQYDGPRFFAFKKEGKCLVTGRTIPVGEWAWWQPDTGETWSWQGMKQKRRQEQIERGREPDATGLPPWFISKELPKLMKNPEEFAKYVDTEEDNLPVTSNAGDDEPF